MSHLQSKGNRKETILNAALNCFTEYGYHKASMDMIAETAEITKRGLYYHFKSKDDLFIELFRFRGEKYFKILSENPFAGSGSEQRLRHFIEQGVKVLEKDDLFMRFLVEFISIAVRNPKVRKVVTGHYRESIQTIKQLLDEGVASGDFKAHPTEKMARTLYFSGLGKFFGRCSFEGEMDLLDQHMFDTEKILSGIRA